METIASERSEKIKGTNDNAATAEGIRHYIETLICKAVGKALERIDDELAGQCKAKGWKTERRDEQKIHAIYGAVAFKRRS